MKQGYFSVLILVLATLGLGACSTQRPPDRKQTRIDSIAFRQLPPSPTYNRLRWAALDELPPRQPISKGSKPIISPIIQFEAKNKSLSDVALMIQAATRYGTFVASNVAKRSVSLHMLGTLDEIAEALEKQSGAKIVVDHVLQEVRILGGGYIAPEFSQAGDFNTSSTQTGSNEHILPKVSEIR